MSPDPLGPAPSVVAPSAPSESAAESSGPPETGEIWSGLAPALPSRSQEATPADEWSAGALLASSEVVAPRRAPRRSKRWKKPIAWAQLACLAFVAYIALFNVSVVRGSSMAPGIHDGDRIVVDHFAYLLGPVHRGDVVVLKYPLDPSLDYIKRIIGLPGDEIVIDHGCVWVNGKQLAEPYVESEDPLCRTSVRVQAAHYFVLGDNRPRSSDSREFGQVPMDYVRGRVEVRLWPLSRIGAVR